MRLFSGVRARLHAVVLLPILLFFIISYSLFHFYVHRLIEQDYTRHLQHILSLEKRYINTWFEERLQVIRILAKGSSNFDGNWNKMEEYITEFTAAQEDFSSLSITDANGYSISTTSGSQTMYLGESELYEDAIAGGTSVSETHISELSGKPGIGFSAPIRTEQGRIIGTLLSHIELDRIESLLHTIHQSRIGEVYLLNSEGYYISSPSIISVFKDDEGQQISPVLERKAETEIFTRALEGREEKETYINYAGRRVFGTYVWLEDLQWILVGETDSKKVYQRYSGYSSFLIILIFIGALLLFPVILQMGNTISTPLRFLDREAQRLKTEQGKIDANWELFRKAPVEIRNLAYSLFTMSEKLHEQLLTLEKVTISDVLTGLFNRAHLFEEGLRYIHMARRTDLPLAALMIDIDNFKSFNDNYGHSFGDKVLREVGRTIRNSVRESDLPARYGGEEFVVLAYKADMKEATHLAERLRQEVEAQEHMYETPEKDEEGSRETKRETKIVKITVSIGLAPLEEQFEGIDTRKSVKDSLEELLGRADEALYTAKEGGRNRVETWRGDT